MGKELAHDDKNESLVSEVFKKKNKETFTDKKKKEKRKM